MKSMPRYTYPQSRHTIATPAGCLTPPKLKKACVVTTPPRPVERGPEGVDARRLELAPRKATRPTAEAETAKAMVPTGTDGRCDARVGEWTLSATRE